MWGPGPPSLPSMPPLLQQQQPLPSLVGEEAAQEPGCALPNKDGRDGDALAEFLWRKQEGKNYRIRKADCPSRPEGPGRERGPLPPLTVVQDHVKQVIGAHVVHNDCCVPSLLGVMHLREGGRGVRGRASRCTHSLGGWGGVGECSGSSWCPRAPGTIASCPGEPTLASKWQSYLRMRAMKPLVLDASGGASTGWQALAGFTSTRRPWGQGRRGARPQRSQQPGLPPPPPRSQETGDRNPGKCWCLEGTPPRLPSHLPIPTSSPSGGNGFPKLAGMSEKSMLELWPDI